MKEIVRKNARSFRLICNEKDIEALEDLLRSEGFEFETEPFHPLARVLTKEPFGLGASLAAAFGRIYIQDRSSMLPPVMLAPESGDLVLDMCASPGSKTGFLSQLVGNDGFVVGNEPAKDRLAVLRQNLRRLNLPQVHTTGYNGEDLDFPDGYWDLIQLDPPCSGWGTEDKNPNASQLWSGEKTEPLEKLQRELLEKASRLLRDGGRVLYSTCTTNVRENEEQVRWALDTLPFKQAPLPEPAGFTLAPSELDGVEGIVRVPPGDMGQGFFLACFEKVGGEEYISDSRNKNKRSFPGKRLKKEKLVCAAPICWDNLPDGELYEFSGQVYFLNGIALDVFPDHMRWQGLGLGKVSGKNFRPDPESRVLVPDFEIAEKTFPDNFLNVTEAEELKVLLSGQGLSTPTSKGKGAVALYFKGLPLGWLGRKGKRLLWSGKKIAAFCH
ncbi:MAG: RsmB/NOP family class I SAM-dependent RNA methyltransferase [Desulfovibrio sp.]